MEINLNDVLTNLKNYDSWDYKNYPLSKEEATIIIKACERCKYMLESIVRESEGKSEQA